MPMYGGHLEFDDVAMLGFYGTSNMIFGRASYPGPHLNLDRRIRCMDSHFIAYLSGSHVNM